jgi:hypothetical protein
MDRNDGGPSRRDVAIRLYAEGMGCNCDLDNWQPEQSTGHSWVCRIHKAAMAETLPIAERAKERTP